METEFVLYLLPIEQETLELMFPMHQKPQLMDSQLVIVDSESLKTLLLPMGSAKKRPGKQPSTAQDWSRAHRVVAMPVYRESEAYDSMEPLGATE